MKKISSILVALGLFSLTLILAFRQGSVAGASGLIVTQIDSLPLSLALYSGFQVMIVESFISLLNGLIAFFGGSLLIAVMALALLVELILLFPSVSLQLKQKKIHLFHKKLVDRFKSGELSLSKSKNELSVMYAVNEGIHARGALLFLAQLLVFIAVLWSLNVFTLSYAFSGAQSSLNSALLAKPASFLLPLFAGLASFFHSIVKIYFKQKEDYISLSQSRFAIGIAGVTAMVVYFFSGIFSALLTVYFVTLITFSTVRYLVVEQQANAWGKTARKHLLHMLREAPTHSSFLGGLSAKWNHFAFVRHTNVHLLEEAASMSLLLMLAISSL